MRFLTLSFLLLCGVLMNAQTLRFSYDTAGNQTIREFICVTCMKAAPVKDTIHSEDLIVSDVSNQISYYPNPVKEDLYVKWMIEENYYVTNISVYTISGQLLKSYTDTNKDTSMTISFLNYPAGLYTLMLTYNNGKSKTLKIIKN